MRGQIHELIIRANKHLNIFQNIVDTIFWTPIVALKNKNPLTLFDSMLHQSRDRWRITRHWGCLL